MWNISENNFQISFETALKTNRQTNNEYVLSPKLYDRDIIPFSNINNYWFAFPLSLCHQQRNNSKKNLFAQPNMVLYLTDANFSSHAWSALIACKTLTKNFLAIFRLRRKCNRIAKKFIFLFEKLCGRGWWSYDLFVLHFLRKRKNFMQGNFLLIFYKRSTPKINSEPVSVYLYISWL